MGAICGVSRGRYIKPVLFSNAGINFIDEDYETVPAPIKHDCEHINHWKWGKGTRNGQKLYYPLSEMYYQKWRLTNKELDEAIKNYDMFSLEMKGRIICSDCAKIELNLNL